MRIVTLGGDESFLDNGSQPEWSPDGTRIVYVGVPNQSHTWYDLFVSSPVGGDPYQLTRSKEYEGSPAWSPDARNVAFIDAGDIEVMAVDSSPDTGPTTLLPRSMGWFPDELAWSPDGKRIAFSNGYEQLCTVTVATAQVGCLIDAANILGLDWSPGGESLVYSATSTDGHDIFVVNADGSGALDVTSGIRKASIYPSWSPDGTSIVFSKGPLHHEYDLFMTDPTGTSSSRFTDTPQDELGADWGPACTVVGTPGDDTINGTPGDDFICGLGGVDEIRGRLGDDRLLGGPGRDDLIGGGDNDMLIGGGGPDHLHGNFGNDAIDARDHGTFDHVDGGLGADVCLADATDVVTSCI